MASKLLIKKYGIEFFREYCHWRVVGGFGAQEALARIRNAHAKGWTPHGSY